MHNITKVKVSNKYNIKEKSEVTITDNLPNELNASGRIHVIEEGMDLTLETKGNVVLIDYGDSVQELDYADITSLYLSLKVLHERQGYRTKKITEEDFNV